VRSHATRIVGGAGVLCACALLLGGCSSGGGSGKPPREPQEHSDRSSGLTRIPVADREAFLELANASGALRAAAAPVALGHAARAPALGALAHARSRVSALRPRDPSLARLQTTLLAALPSAHAFQRPGKPKRQLAQRAIADTDHINTGLRAYAREHPAIGGLVPD
jgi:hypothetical protein